MVAFFGVAALLGSTLLQSVSGNVLERRDFNFEDHLGNLSPYHKAPIPHGIKEDLPADCKVEQVMLVRSLLVLIDYIAYLHLS